MVQERGCQHFDSTGMSCRTSAPEAINSSSIVAPCRVYLDQPPPLILQQRSAHSARLALAPAPAPAASHFPTSSPISSHHCLSPLQNAANAVPVMSKLKACRGWGNVAVFESPIPQTDIAGNLQIKQVHG